MTPRVAIRRLATGVPGLDAVLGGGLPEFSFNLIAGPPGCGKTTLAHQMMFALASRERPALYLTVLGEPPLKMLRYQQQFDFFDTEAIDDSVFFLNLADAMIEGDLTQVLARVAAEVEKRGPAFVFVDSFRSVVLSNTSSGNTHNTLQRLIQQLGMLMTSWQATTFLIGEYALETDTNPVFTAADGLIWLRQSVQRNSMVRKMEIVKMRGQPTLPGLHTFRIDQAGLRVFVPAHIFEPFVQDAHAPRFNGEGLGIGLTVVRELVSRTVARWSQPAQATISVVSSGSRCLWRHGATRRTSGTKRYRRYASACASSIGKPRISYPAASFLICLKRICSIDVSIDSNCADVTLTASGCWPVAQR